MPDPAQPPKTIAVIGGGISGLAAAHRLRELDPLAEVTLFEASNRLGGIISTIRRDGFLIEQSADSFITNAPSAIDLCRRIGLVDDLIPTNAAHRGATVVSRGKLHRVPDGFVLMAPNRLGPTLRSPILSLSGKARLLCERFIKPRRETSDESVADFARRRLGREVFERLVQPLVGGIYTADPERLSMAAALPRFLEMERRHGSLSRALSVARQGEPLREDAKNHPNNTSPTDLAESGARYSLFMTPRDGLSTLIEKLNARLSPDCVQLNTEILGLEKVGNRWRLTIKPKTSGAGFEDVTFQFHEVPEFDAIVLATPAPAASKLLANVDVDLSAELADIEHAGSSIVCLGYDEYQFARPLDSFGFVVPAIERRKILSASFSSVKFPGRAPTRKILIRVFLGGALQPELLSLPDNQLVTIAESELRDLLGITGPSCLSLVFRWPRYAPISSRPLGSTRPDQLTIGDTSQSSPGRQRLRRRRHPPMHQKRRTSGRPSPNRRQSNRR